MLVIITGIIIALAFFFYFDKRRLHRLEDQQEKNRERFEHLLKTLRPPEEQPGRALPAKQDE